MTVVKWNLRMVAAQRDIWRPTQLLEALSEVGFTPSLSKVAALWSGTPVTVRLDDLDKICAVLGCTVGDLLHPNQSPRPRNLRTFSRRSAISGAVPCARRPREAPAAELGGRYRRTDRDLQDRGQLSRLFCLAQRKNADLRGVPRVAC